MKVTCCPYSAYDFSGCESWLQQQAEKGLYLRYFYWPLVFMAEDTPQKLRYHIEPPSTSDRFEALREQQELYEAAGWHYLCELDCGSLYQTADPEAAEPYTDDDSRADSLKALEKGLRSQKNFQFFVLVVLLAAIAATVFTADLRSLPQMAALAVLCVYAAWAVWSAFREFRSYRRMRRLCTSLRSGRRPPAERPLHPAPELAYDLFSGVILLMLLGSHLAI